ncbi:MAG: glycosyltransferase family 4 protein [Verrucomicrobiales bacterium]|nr:glycosyltransferase family 4 protein [Verrucomicrobiales bacterium]
MASFPGERPELDRLRAAGVEVHVRQRAVPTRVARWWRRLRGLAPVRLEDEIFGWVQAGRPDLVCVSQGGALDGRPWMAGCHRRGLPYVVVVQAHTASSWPTASGLDELTAGYQGARSSYFVAARNRELLEDQLGVVLARARQVRNPFHPSVPEAPLAWPDTADGYRLACVARLDPPAKGQDLLLKALAAESWRERPVRVTFFGRGGAEEGLRRLSARLGLRGVTFAGHVGDIRRLWEEHHALVLPSRYEGLPLSLVEAAWCGRPAVVTDVDGNTELVEEGRTGYVAEAATVPFLAAALERAWRDRERWPALGRAARQRAESMFPRDPVEAFAEELVRVAGQGGVATA